MDIQQFKNPGNKYREIVLWSWNDVLEDAELIRQIDLMEKAGWGGFVMHARIGLATAYMGQRWLHCVQLCVEEAAKRGMKAWLYDEDKWPSGYAGGLGAAANPEYRAQFLACKVDSRAVLMAERIATFSAQYSAGTLHDIRVESNPVLSDEETRVIQFYPVRMAPGQLQFTEYTYADLLNPQAVQAFLVSTYEVYAQQVGSHFGTTIPAIFTDEPCYHMHTVYSQGAKLELPWTTDFPAYFREQNGYDLLPLLPSLIFDVGDFHAVRYDYWRTVTRKFIESFTRPLAEWCKAHGISFAGHYMGEDNLLAQVQWIGAAMPHYAHMHIPGVDKLGRQMNVDAGTVTTLKQLDSVVCQMGKPRALCEINGVSGQDFSFKGRKWIGDWAYVLGITLSDPHLALYSMRGERKRDCPPNLFFQQPWWPENRLSADYFARLSYLLSQGERVVDVVVLHPIGSAWAVYSPASTWAVSRLDAALEQLAQTLMQAHYDFHFADESLIEPGSGAEGQVILMDNGPRLKIGRMVYRVVIVPPSVTLSEATVRLLRQFAQSGGQIVAIEPTPHRINGRASEDAVLPGATQIATIDGSPALLDSLIPFDVRIDAQPALWVHHRRAEEQHIYFVANTDADHAKLATLYIRGHGYLEEWDPATGERCAVPHETREGNLTVTLNFAPGGSHLLVLQPTAPDMLSTPPLPLVQCIPLDDFWQLTLSSPNALTLDYAQMRLGDGAWSQPMPILDAQASLARGELSEHTPIFWGGAGTPFALRYSFDVLHLPAAPVYLVVETPAAFTIQVNGQIIQDAGIGWWIDPSFRKIDISAHIQGGRNTVELSAIFRTGMELESAYIVGDFGLEVVHLGRESQYAGQTFDRYASRFQIVQMQDHVPPKQATTMLTTDLTAQGIPGYRAEPLASGTVDLTMTGWPFFAGRVRLRQSIDILSSCSRIVMEFGNLSAALANIYLNGTMVGATAWPPYSVAIDSGWQPGRNAIEIELVSTLRNLLGPHHLAGGDREWTAPEHFRMKSRWTEDYILVPFGFKNVQLKIY